MTYNRQKRILVTGAGGFIGSHLTELLVEKGYDVTAFVRYNSKGDWGWLEYSKYKDEIKVVTGDIRDYDSVLSTMKSCDEVFHLAALIGIPYSYISPLAYIQTNITGTYNILQAARELEISKLMVTSTSETYGSAQYVPIDEYHPMVGQSPYSASKIGADQLAISYFRSFGLPVKIVRPFNTYGPRQSARAFIPSVISQIMAGAKEIKLGNLHPTRDLTFVEDTASGFLAIAEAEGLYGEFTNIGMKEEIPMGDLANIIAKLSGKEIKIITDSQRIRNDKSEVDRLFCSNDKIKKFTNWKPEYNLESGLTKTIAWIGDNMQFFKSEIYNV